MKIAVFFGVLLSVSLREVRLYEAGNEPVDEACNCDHCFKTNAEGEEQPPVAPILKEDADGDGRLLICARARDLPDRSFPSVCHMLCHNRCTRYTVSETIEGSVTQRTVIASRTNYYKLRDGRCSRL